MPSGVLTTGTFIGVLTIVATLISPLIWDRWISKPKLIIKPVERPGEKPPAIRQLREGTAAFYHVNVKNKGRAPAKNLRPTLVFYKDDHKVCSFSPKWDFNPEPLTLRYWPTQQGKPKPLPIPEPSLMPQGALIDIPPHGEENFCTLIKYEDENECYGFSAFNYLYPDLKSPLRKLDPGEYRVKLDLIGDNVHEEVWLKIECKRWVDVEKRRNIEEMFSYAAITNVEG